MPDRYSRRREPLRGKRTSCQCRAAPRKRKKPQIGRRTSERIARRASSTASSMKAVARSSASTASAKHGSISPKALGIAVSQRPDRRAHIGDFAMHRLAPRQPEFSLHEIDFLNAIGAFVDRGNPRVAEKLRRAGLFDIAHAAMNLNSKRGNLIADVGGKRLGDRRQQGGPLPRPRSRADCLFPGANGRSTPPS